MSYPFEMPGRSANAWAWLAIALVLIFVSAVSGLMAYVAARAFVPGGAFIVPCGSASMVLPALLAYLCVRRAQRIREER